MEQGDPPFFQGLDIEFVSPVFSSPVPSFVLLCLSYYPTPQRYVQKRLWPT